MDKKRIHWGIIGCGDVTEKKSGPAFYTLPHTKLTAVMRRNAAKAADYAKRHNVSNWYDNAVDLINDPEVEAVGLRIREHGSSFGRRDVQVPTVTGRPFLPSGM